MPAKFHQLWGKPTFGKQFFLQFSAFPPFIKENPWLLTGYPLQFTLDIGGKHSKMAETLYSIVL
jgi:hypothetical protein